MKKKMVVILIAVLILATSCGAKWEQVKKDWNSNLDGGLPRKVEVVNQFSGETVWSFEGKCYIDGESSVGNVTIVYYDALGVSKKVDFIGNFYGVQAYEL